MISPTLLYRGTLTTSSATLVTTNGGGTTVVSSIVVANKTATASWFTLVVDGMYIAYQMPIAGNQTITLDVKQVVVGAKTITGLAGANSTVDVHISGNVQTGAQYVLNGNGSPEGVITANVGSEYIQQDDSQLGYLKWSKLSGTGNTGWYPDFDGRWKTYTPTLSGWTLGSGSTSGRYTQYGKLINFAAKAVLGTGFSISGSPSLSVPVTSANQLFFYGVGNYTSAGVNNWVVFPRMTSTTSFTFVVGWSNYNAEIAQTTTVPFTWKATDIINLSATYEAA